MPTDVLLAADRRIVGEKKKAADLRAVLLLVPLIACLGSLALALKSPAFAAAIIAMGMG